MHEITESRSRTFTHFILATARFTEIGDGRQFGVDWSATEPTVIQIFSSLLCIFLTTKLYVDISHKVIAQVIAHVHFLYFSVLVFAFDEHILKEIVVMLLHFLVGNIGHQMAAIGRFS